MVANAFLSAADLVFLDLEDAVPESEKLAARAASIRQLNLAPESGQIRAARVNSLETRFGYQDIVELVEGAGSKLDVLILPKIKAAREVWWVDLLLDKLESKVGLGHRIGLEVLIEEVEALISVEDIAQVSSRLQALVFGAWDFAASQGVVTSDLPADMWQYARNRILVAARAARLNAIDSPYLLIDDLSGLREECVRADVMGFAGKWVIHPKQISVVNDVFTPSRTEVDRALQIVTAYEAAQAHGRGAIRVGGQLVDVATVRMLRNLLAKAETYGA